MLKLIKEYRFYCTIALLIFIPILSLNTSNKAETDFNFFDRAVVFVTSPIQGMISFTIDHAARFMQNYIFLINTRRDLSNVVEENRKLLNTIHNFKEMEAENKRLRALLQFQEKVEEKKITAQVIAKDVSTEFRSIRINKGSNAGIQRGMAVVTHEGVVGKILRVTSDYADVITMLDNLSSIDAIVQRTRAHGLVEGATDASCILKFALRTDDIDVDDVVVSSGLDGIYPKGLMLGKVIKVSKKTFGVTQNVEIRPSVDFSKLEEVLVILKPD
ncbi:MAG: rod shape-determining protein MreC, partial [Deltaproteobacteria bacterium]|nr:rod shape-determining protein MreC [Deltaproteobacteria bacterium]